MSLVVHFNGRNHIRLYDSLKQLKLNQIIDSDTFEKSKLTLLEKYGELD
ncbi:hypothetical protein [Cytobacillus gottheilii]|nr:hypothetical protein [Cytobacillus gottheilii]